MVVVPVAVSDSSVWYRDAVGDVKGGPGPDIAFVRGTERAGRISFRVVMSKTPPLAASTTRGFTDMLLVSIWTGRTRTRQPQYWLGVHGAAPTRVALVDRLKKTHVWVAPAIVSRRTVILSVDPQRIGDPKALRFSVTAGRELNEGQGGSEDYAPDSGTSPLWVR